MNKITQSSEAAEAAILSAARNEFLTKHSSDPYIGYESFDEANTDVKCTSQAAVISRLLNRENVFISGPAGSGKTFVINHFQKLIDAEYNGNVNIALTASTGIAAQLIGGKTIHSWSGMGISTEPFDRSNISRGEKSAMQRLREAHILVIDEVSMLPAYLFQRLDGLLKYARRNKKPFGGVQIVLMGDFLQLPPVPQRPNYDGFVPNSNFAIMTDEWSDANFSYCYMDKVRRATDPKLKYVLSAISRDKVDEKAKMLVSSRSATRNKMDPKKAYATLFTTNKNVDAYNDQKLAENTNHPVQFEAEYDGDSKHWPKIVKEYGLKEIFDLKVGATVMVTSNLEKMPNGTIGRVLSFSSDGAVKILTNDGHMAFVEPMAYTHTVKVKAEDEDGKPVTNEHVVSTVTQVPLKLGYAISVHKSQGQTFDGVVADLSKCFTPGLGYVALSRVRSLEDLIITDIKDSAFSIDKKSLKVSNYVKKKAFEGRVAMLEESSHYENLLTNGLHRQTVWGMLALEGAARNG